MSFKGLGTYIKVFVMLLILIVVYKTFDNLGFVVESVKKVFDILSPLFVGFFIAFLLCPMCNLLEKTYEKCPAEFVVKRKRIFSVITIFGCFVVLVSIVVSFIVPAIIKSARELITQLPNMYNSIIELIKGWGFEDFDTWTIVNNIPFDKLVERMEITNISKYIQGVASVSSVIVDFVLSIILAIYILVDRELIKQGTRRVYRLLFRQEKREVITHYFRLTQKYMYKYFGCLLLDAVVVFVLSSIVLIVLRVEYAPLLAVVMGVCNLIPYFGAFFAVVIIILIALVTSGISKAIVVGISLIILQQIDANIIQPHIVKDSLSIRPFWVIISILIGGGLFGFIGIIISVPIMAIILRISEDLIRAKESKIISDNSSIQ